MKKITYREKRQIIHKDVLPEVRKLVAKFDLASVQSAVKTMYEERKAQNELKAAERKVEELKRKVSK